MGATGGPERHGASGAAKRVSPKHRAEKGLMPIRRRFVSPTWRPAAIGAAAIVNSG